MLISLRRNRWLSDVQLRLCVAMIVATAPGALAQEVWWIDPYGGGPREIPDLANGGFVTLSEDEIIDVVVLGDGYPDSTGGRTTFFDEAQAWYDTTLSEAKGIRPYHLFSEAFRVRAVYQPSSVTVSPDRLSWYRVAVECTGPCAGIPEDGNCLIDGSGWACDSGEVNHEFRDRFFSSIDGLNPPVNYRRYPSNLSTAVDNCAGGQSNIIPPLADTYSNLVVLMLVRGDLQCDGDGRIDGKTMTVCCAEGEGCGTDPVESTRTRQVRMAAGAAERHEFSHAFGFLRDEYIEPRGSTACLTNPVGSDRSIYLLSNLSYSGLPCDAPWAHLAPGSHYNPHPQSPVGNLFRGGNEESGVWHSEYKCLMNGLHQNYFCDIDEPGPDDPGYDPASLRDQRRFCFWCEEITAIRILEKTRQFGPGDPSNSLGRVWFDLWDTTLRHSYYTRFNIAHRIEQRAACLGVGTCPCPLGDCQSSSCDPSDPVQADNWWPCDTTDIPSCLTGCTIHEIGSAVYVDSESGSPTNPGTRDEPLASIPGGVQQGCGPAGIVAILPGYYPEPLTITGDVNGSVTLMAEGCTSVILGN